MTYHIDEQQPCNLRVVLGDFAQKKEGATIIQNSMTALPADFADKNGHALVPCLTDMAQRGGGRLLLNLAADALSVWLAQEKPTLLAQGAAVLYHAGACAEMVICVPELPKCATINTLCEALVAQGITTEIRAVPASPVLRTETALYAALDTGVGRVYPLCAAFLSEGWQHRPCCVVDGETACAALIAAHGLPRTKLIAVCAADKENAAICEVPLGTMLSELCPPHASAKPVLLGEMPGVFLAQQVLAKEKASFCWQHDIITFYEDGACMADCAAKHLQAAAAQSCHNCVLCREGSWHLQSIFTSITQGKAKRDDLTLVEDIAPIIAQGALCTFGRTLAQTALTAVQTEAVRTELEAHIGKKTCPAGVCVAFSGFVILPDRCTGCGECLDVCDEDAIEGKDGFIHIIDPALCEKCGKCAAACEENAIVRSTEKIRVPKKLTRVGRFS